MPLEEDAPVRTATVIGRHAKRPLVLENPVYISHMSFGALSREAKIALAMGFADQSYYCKSFKRIVGIPPGRFRQSV